MTKDLGANTRATRIAEQVAIEQAIKKHRKDKIQKNLSAILSIDLGSRSTTKEAPQLRSGVKASRNRLPASFAAAQVPTSSANDLELVMDALPGEGIS